MQSLFAVAPFIAACVAQSYSGPIYNPCGQVRDAALNHTIIEATIAYDCLISVPFKLDPALKTLDAVGKMSEYQSDLEYLANPPSTYPEEPVDIMEGLEMIRQNATSGVYNSEYQFEKDIALLFQSAYDSHFDFKGYLWFGLVQFRRVSELSLVSVSSDGTFAPKIYLQADISSPSAPEVIKIDGEPASTFIGRESRLRNWNNPYARYNLMFSRVTAHGQIFPGFFLGPPIFPGPYTEIQYSNGSTIRYSNYAIVQPNPGWEMVTDAETLYDVLVDANNVDIATKPLESFHTAQQVGLSVQAIPDLHSEPVMRSNVGDNETRIAGYFIDTPYEDRVAVLTIPTFVSMDPSHPTSLSSYLTDFLESTQSFLEYCREKGSQKLIIDLRGNTGGLTALAFNVFHQLFPSVETFSGTRFRVSELTEAILEELGEMNEDDGSVVHFARELSTLDYRHGATVNGENFTSTAEKLGNDVYNGERVSRIVRIGHEDLFPPFIGKDATFEPENILILSDGVCASTCAIFVEMLSNDVRVHTLAIGGAPENGPMAFAGGTKGSQVVDFVADIIPVSESIVEKLNETDSEAAAAKRSIFPVLPGTATLFNSVNLMDTIRNASSTVPTQFLVDNADCRIWYTPQAYLNPVDLWKDAYKAIWTEEGQDMCVVGSVGLASSPPPKGSNTIGCYGDSIETCSGGPDGVAGRKIRRGYDSGNAGVDLSVEWTSMLLPLIGGLTTLVGLW